MKYVLTLEAYMLKTDLGKLVDMSKVETALRVILRRALPTNDDKWFDSFTDQTVDDKGIKYEIKIKKDLIHAFLKKGRSIYSPSDWEFYLNKKKISFEYLLDHLESTLMTDLDLFIKYGMSYDFYASYIDDGGQYNRAVTNNSAIEKRFGELSSSDKKKALNALYSKFDKKNVDSVFKA